LVRAVIAAPALVARPYLPMTATQSGNLYKLHKRPAGCGAGSPFASKA
jgi:hypothetical protein